MVTLSFKKRMIKKGIYIYFLLNQKKTTPGKDPE